jgi:Ribosomal protein S19
MGLIKKLRKAKKEAPPNEKPAVVKTHLRDMIIVPEMIGSVVGIYNGKVCIRLCHRVVGLWRERCKEWDGRREWLVNNCTLIIPLI